uniref:Uncharacterized protein n=1 Tax=Anguilla anguilla TaxID=7936 RepID=A0A0E9PRW8_ANGAN
MSGRRERESD